MKSSLQTAVPATARRPPVERFRAQSRSRLFRADLLTVLAWGSVALAVALWLADGGAAGSSTLAGSFAALGIVAGLAGMDLVRPRGSVPRGAWAGGSAAAVRRRRTSL